MNRVNSIDKITLQVQSEFNISKANLKGIIELVYKNKFKRSN